MTHKDKVKEITDSIDFSATKYQVEMKTSEGDIVLDLFPEKAPNHCKNIIGLAKSGFYDGLIFHRVIADFMIQGGCPEGSGMGGPGYHVDQEFNDTPHEPGVLSMARAADPNSAGSQFFICTAKVPHLDGQYTAFGKTADEGSLGVALKIGGCQTAAQDRPVSDVVINKVEIRESAI